MSVDYVCLGVLLVILATVEAASFCAYGYRSVGNVVSIVASTVVVPILSLLSIHLFLESLGMERFQRVLRVALFIVFTFGVIAFATYNLAGKVIGIPFVTTTGQDIELIADRHNLRGTIIKMFSTYNNGNILGVNLLIWGPLAAMGTGFARFEFRSICILSLSRSVWVGLAAFEIISSVVRRSIRKTLYAATFVLLLMAVFVATSWFIGRDPTAFLFDRNLGGRVANFEKDLYGIKTQKIGWTNESLYAAAYLAFGWTGALLIAAIWVYPVLRGGRGLAEVQCRIALAVYLFVASAEAAFNLIPTQASYWMIAGIAMGAARAAGGAPASGQNARGRPTAALLDAPRGQLGTPPITTLRPDRRDRVPSAL
jgi:hypothetical protein